MKLSIGRFSQESFLRPSNPKRGFALLITITLLAFLVLLLVSLASLTRVETQVAGNNQAISQARQNALLGLNIALGQLQKYTGPDQRVTARAEILDTDPLNRVNASGTPDADGQPKIDGVPNPYWTGVWDSSKWHPLTGLYDGLAGGARGNRKPDAMVWLVSGNETQGIAVLPTVALAASAAKQTLFSGVTPSGAIDPVAPRVEVPLIEILSSSYPGMPSGQPVGHYAYWVGDEGVKAKVTIRPAETVAASTSAGGTVASEGYYWKAMNPARSGIELFTTAGTTNRVFPDFQNVFATNAAGATARTNLGKMLSGEQLALLQAGAPATTVLTAAGLRLHAFDLTTTSQGVIADTVRGGLRMDLTRYLETGNTDGAFDGTESIYKDAALSGARQPSYALLKSWYDIGRGFNGGFSPSAAIQSEAIAGNSITRMGLFPVITRFHIVYAGMGNGPGQPFRIVMHPCVTLWNPHNVALNAEDLVMEIEQGLRAGIAVNSLPLPGRSYANGNADLVTQMGGPLRLRIPGVRFEPGETLVFTLDTPTSPAVWSAPLGSSPAVGSFPPMVPRYNNRNYVALNTQLILNATPLAPGETLQYTLGAAPFPTWRLKARLYQASNYNGGTPLQNIESPSGQGFATTPAYAYESTPPVDTSVFRGEIASMNMPLSDTHFNGGSTVYVPAVPFATFNLRGAFSRLTSFEASRGALEGDPFFLWTRSNTLPLVTIEPGPLKDLAFTGATTAPTGLATTALGNYAIMFDYPRRETAASTNSNFPSVTSLGEFQHVDMSSFMFQPTYVFGNSLPDPRIDREKISGRTAGNPAVEAEQISNAVNDVYLRDASYLANHALWDRFFLSTIPQSGSGSFGAQTTLANTRLKAVEGTVPGVSGYPAIADVRSVTKAAGSLLLDGAFNVNSTSVDAWRAFLGGLAEVPVPDAGWSQNGVLAGSTANPTAAGLRHNYSRFLLPRSHAFDQTSGSFAGNNMNAVQNAVAWTGHRYLSDTEIDRLARNLVEEVKVRGPFMSVADFVNRRLIAASAEAGPAGVSSDVDVQRKRVGSSGAIHRALLNLTNITQGVNAALNQPVVASKTFSYTGGTAQAYAINGGSGFRGLSTLPNQLELAMGGLVGQLAFGAPGFVTQADVLQKIGGGIAARSDTFVIRTYGDAYNPSTTTVEGRAWCEAVVQRMPEYVDASVSQPPEAGSSAAGSVALNATNQAFGRRYKIISFRWLTPADL